MIIDAHAHLEVFESIGLDDGPEKVISYMEYAGIDMACISTYTNQPGMHTASLEYYADCVKQYPGKFVPFVRLDPGYGDRTLKVIDEAVMKYGFKGIKLHPIDYSLAPFEDGTIKILKKAAHYDIPVLYHCSDEIMCLPLQIEWAAEACPEAKIILGHMGGFFHQDDAIEIAKRCDNVYLETCEQPFVGGIKKAVEEIGADRLLFGTDIPTDNPLLELEKIRYAKLGYENEEKILFKNIARLIHF
ncbi:MAG: amidohydrolase family protein [Proteocatella sp.]